MSRKVHIRSYPHLGVTRMSDAEDCKILVEIYDQEVDQEQTLVEFAEKLGYVIVDEYEYEKQQ